VLSYRLSISTSLSASFIKYLIILAVSYGRVLVVSHWRLFLLLMGARRGFKKSL
jgi:hypothetical protein